MKKRMITDDHPYELILEELNDQPVDKKLFEKAIQIREFDLNVIEIFRLLKETYYEGITEGIDGI